MRLRAAEQDLCAQPTRRLARRAAAAFRGAVRSALVVASNFRTGLLGCALRSGWRADARWLRGLEDRMAASTAGWTQLVGLQATRAETLAIDASRRALLAQAFGLLRRADQLRARHRHARAGSASEASPARGIGEMCAARGGSKRREGLEDLCACASTRDVQVRARPPPPRHRRRAGRGRRRSVGGRRSRSARPAG